MSSSPAAERDALLAPLAYDRARIIAPFVLFAMILALLVSEPTGVPLALPVIAWNAVAIPAIGALTWGLWYGRLPVRWGHVALVLVWALPTIGTLLSKFFVPGALLTIVLTAEVAAGAILLRTRWTIAAYLVIDIAWIPLALREPDTVAMMSILTVTASQIVSGLFQRVFISSLLRAEQQLADLRASERERAALTEQLMHAQRLEVAGTLAAGLAHDMNNVLASIRGLAELQLAESPPPAMAADLAHIVTQSERGAELTRGLLAFSRRGQYRRQVLELDGALRELLPLLSRTLPKSLELITDLRAGASRIEVDPHHLGQVIMNLAVNAADAMP
ncbi:MAG: histidine kinase dimerization/phospho-acceptor domain-containing protein, partial [Polyangiales bacterium]